MHYKDGTPARPGDIIKSDSGAIGCVIGGNAHSDACNLHVLVFSDTAKCYGNGATFGSAIYGDGGAILERCAVTLQLMTCMQSKQCEPIAHVDIGNG